VALPFLDAMYPALAAQTVKKALGSPTRMAFLYVPNGIVMNEWTPAGELGATPLGDLPRVSKALAPYRNDVMFLSGLTSNGGRALGDGPGDHGRAGAAYLTGVHPKKTYGKDIQTGISMDQFAARSLEAKRGSRPWNWAAKTGFRGATATTATVARTATASRGAAVHPNPPEIRPRAVFERLFGAADQEKDPAKRRRLQSYEKSILDVIMGDAQSLKTSLGGSDRRKVDEYLTAIRDIEKRIQNVEKDNATRVVNFPMEALSGSVPTDFTEHSRIMFDLMTLALQDRSDAHHDGAPRDRAEPAQLPGDWHYGRSPRPDAPPGRQREDREGHADQRVPHQAVHLPARQAEGHADGDGTLLDHSMIVYGSALADGNAHQHNNLPTVIAGRGNGTLKPGRHVKYADEHRLRTCICRCWTRWACPWTPSGTAPASSKVSPTFRVVSTHPGA
jgi:hypothetical protein